MSQKDITASDYAYHSEKPISNKKMENNGQGQGSCGLDSTADKCCRCFWRITLRRRGKSMPSALAVPLKTLEKFQAKTDEIGRVVTSLDLAWDRVSSEIDENKWDIW